MLPAASAVPAPPAPVQIDAQQRASSSGTAVYCWGCLQQREAGSWVVGDKNPTPSHSSPSSRPFLRRCGVMTLMPWGGLSIARAAHDRRGARGAGTPARASPPPCQRLLLLVVVVGRQTVSGFGARCQQVSSLPRACTHAPDFGPTHRRPPATAPTRTAQPLARRPLAARLWAIHRFSHASSSGCSSSASLGGDGSCPVGTHRHTTCRLSHGPKPPTGAVPKPVAGTFWKPIPLPRSPDPSPLLNTGSPSRRRPNRPHLLALSQAKVSPLRPSFAPVCFGGPVAGVV